MERFISLTLNPCIDKTMFFKNPFRAGELNRAQDSLMSAGGKGINVSRVLKRFDIYAPSFSFEGGETGRLLMALLKLEELPAYFQPCSSETRMCVKMIDENGGCTEANETGGPFTEGEFRKLTDEFCNYTARERSTVFLGGSIPRGIPQDAYRMLILRLSGIGARVILDADGEALRYGLESHPLLIKPNEKELSTLCGKKISGKTAEERLRCAARMAKETALKYRTQVLCTLGADGALYTDGACLYAVNAPRVPVRGFTGAGDTFLAAFVAARSRGLPDPEALRRGASAAAAKVASPGTEIPGKEDMERRLDEVRLLENISVS